MLRLVLAVAPRPAVLAASLLACLALVPVGVAQDVDAAEDVPPAVRLDVGRVHEATTEPGTTGTYAVDLAAGQFALVEVVQRTVDVVARVVGPSGERVAATDATARGPESLAFVAGAAGTYRVEVAPFEGQSGRYAVELRKAEPVATTPAGTVDQLMAPYDGTDRPGAAVAVVRGGEVVFARAYGMADLAHGVPNTPETVFNVASVSKPFAGAAFALLAEQGRLSLDDDVRTYLPELPDFGATVTLRHLLTHTSGLREFSSVPGVLGRAPAEGGLDAAGVLALVQRQPALQFAPGSRSLYNNTGFVLLAMVAERVTGVPYPDWMAEHVFGPLGMDRTRVQRVEGEVVPDVADGYLPAETGGYRLDDGFGPYGPTGVHSTVRDLARWMGAFRTGELGGVGVVRRMVDRPVLADGDTLIYGLGLSFHDDYALGLDRVGHVGSAGGYRSAFDYYPALDAGVVVLANTGALDAGSVARATAAAFFAPDARLEPTARPDPIAADPVPVDEALLDAYAGSYWIDGAGLYTITRDGDGLAMRTFYGASGPLVALDDSTFRFTPVHSVRFRRGARGERPSAALLVRGEGRIAMDRVILEVEPDLGVYAGRYVSEEAEAVHTLSVEEGRLVLRSRGFAPVVLRAEARDHFVGASPAPEVSFERDATGAVTGYEASDGRTLGVVYRRVGGE